MTEPANTSGELDPALRRYCRQVIYKPIGVEGQRKLGASRAVLIGCGALGTVLANTLVRAGLGHLRICDRDFIERDNLQRQVLFDEADIEANQPRSGRQRNGSSARRLLAVDQLLPAHPCPVRASTVGEGQPCRAPWRGWRRHARLWTLRTP